MMQPSSAYEWCCHVSPPSILESLEFLSYSHMANDLQYVAALVAPYLVMAVSRLLYLGVDHEELAAVKTECCELGEKVWLFKDDRHKFEERYVVQTREKPAAKDQVTSLDEEVEHLLQQVQDLVAGKEAL